MSSGTSTSVASAVRLKPDPTDARDGHGDGPRVDPTPEGGQPEADAGMQPWHLFVLAGLACATAGMFLTRVEGVSGVLLLSALIGSAALVGLVTLLAVRPLVSPVDERSRVIGQRTRDTLEREKNLSLRALKELEFDRAMGKLSDTDFQEMSARLRKRATRLMRQLDAAEGYRTTIEREVAQRLAQSGQQAETSQKEAASTPAIERTCVACETVNDQDARFCKACGAKL